MKIILFSCCTSKSNCWMLSYCLPFWECREIFYKMKNIDSNTFTMFLHTIYVMSLYSFLGIYVALFMPTEWCYNYYLNIIIEDLFIISSLWRDNSSVIIKWHQYIYCLFLSRSNDLLFINSFINSYTWLRTNI